METYAINETERVALDWLELNKPELFDCIEGPSEYQLESETFRRELDFAAEHRVGYGIDPLTRRVTIFER